VSDLLDETANGAYIQTQQDDWMTAKARRTMRRTGWQLQSFWEAYEAEDFGQAAWILNMMQPQ
jgi:hypothetical protein